MTEPRDEGSTTKSPRRPALRRYLPLIAIGAAAATAGIAALLVNIFEHKQEAKNPFYRVVELDDTIEDPAVWGKNFPIQYDGYRRTVDQKRTRFGGSEAVPRTPTQADPRSVVAQSKLEEDGRLKTMWAGYAFSRDFREERGHAHMLEDQVYTERQVATKQPGTCIHCHASVYVPYKKLGGGDLMRGWEAMNQMPFPEARMQPLTLAAIGANDGDQLIACVYDPTARRRIAALLRAVALLAPRHPGLRLAIVGPGAEDDDLRMHAAALGITEIVAHVGQRLDQQAVLSAAELAWVAAGGDNAAFGYLDLMALRVPVLAERDALSSRYVADGICGVLLAQPDPGTMAARIAVLLAHGERRSAMGNAGRARVTRDFSEQDMVDGFERATEIARDRSRWRT